MIRNENEEKLSKLDAILERIRSEDQMRKIRNEERRMEDEKRRAGEMKKQEMKSMEVDKTKDRVRRKRIMEERWELIRWITTYIDSDRKSGRGKNWRKERKIVIDEWDKFERFSRLQSSKKD